MLNMPRFIRLCLCLCFLLTRAYAQNSVNVVVVEDPGVAAQVNKFIQDNKAKPYLSGWRVQILTTTDRLKLDETLANFKIQYPYLPVRWVHERPYYLLRVGACLNRLEAMRLQQLLRQSYAGSYPVQDQQISPMELIGANN
jgi:hypothetical protein